MKVLFDQGTPVPLRKYLCEYAVETAFERGWSDIANGELLALAKSADFAVLITTDQNLRYQQNLAERQISIIVICTTSWPRIQKHVALVLAALNERAPGSYYEISIPKE